MITPNCVEMKHLNWRSTACNPALRRPRLLREHVAEIHIYGHVGQEVYMWLLHKQFMSSKKGICHWKKHHKTKNKSEITCWYLQPYKDEFEGTSFNIGVVQLRMKLQTSQGHLQNTSMHLRFTDAKELRFFQIITINASLRHKFLEENHQHSVHASRRTFFAHFEALVVDLLTCFDELFASCFLYRVLLKIEPCNVRKQ
ncbi:hypothetical protein ACJX0J_035238, partial [Zea mays]